VAEGIAVSLLREIVVSQFGVTLLVLALGLALLWLLVHRVGRLERRLEGLARAEDLKPVAQAAEAAASDARLRPLEEGVRRVADSIARLPSPLEPKDLVPLQERLELLARAVDELRHHVDELRLRGPQPPPDVAPGAHVLRALEQRGYESIRIVGEAAGDNSGEESRVPVEARRGGMSFKGFVRLEDGRVAEVALKPVTEVFP
jgi:hypothetical protein